MTAEKEYSIKFTKQEIKFWLCLLYNGVKSYLFINGVKIHKFKAKYSEINVAPFRLGSISKDFSIDNIKKTGLCGYIYIIFFDYNSTDLDDILDIHKHLLVENKVK